MLHLTNGDATAAALAKAGIEGTIVSVDDILMEGPLRNALATPADLVHRATWLQARLGIPKGEYLAHAGRRARHAREAGADAREVVLWSEEDLFCQANLAHFLATAARPDALRVAAPAEGHVATLAPEALRERLARRRAVRAEHVHAARRFFDALASPDPRAVERFAREGAPVWPALANGARLHLARFPHARDGLGALERALLRTLEAGPRTFREAFAAYAAAPPGFYGIGDQQALAALREMAREPALAFVDDPRALEDAASDARWALTPLGREVLAGRKDAVEARGVDWWLGGVELKGPRAAWRYDGAEGLLRESL